MNKCYFLLILSLFFLSCAATRNTTEVASQPAEPTTLQAIETTPQQEAKLAEDQTKASSFEIRYDQ